MAARFRGRITYLTQTQAITTAPTPPERKLGAKGQRTRQQLIEATVDLDASDEVGEPLVMVSAMRRL